MKRHTGVSNGRLTALLRFVEDFDPAESKDLGWHGWRGKPCGQQQLDKTCFRQR